MIRVLIVDDHAFMRKAITYLLRNADGIVVVGECTDGAEVPHIAPLVQPDVVLMDVQMPLVSGTEATRNLLTRQPAVRVLIVSATTSPQILAEAAAAGASGYMLKGGGARELVAAIRTIAAGGTNWPGDQEPAGKSRSPSICEFSARRISGTIATFRGRHPLAILVARL